jgi:hypothetical protein
MAGDTLKANELIQGADQLAKEMAALNKEFKETINLMIEGQKVFNKQAKSQSDVAKRTEKVKKVTSELEKIQNRANKVTLETVRATEDLRKKRKDLTDQIRKEQGTFKKSTSLFKGMVKSLASVAGAYIGIQTAIRALRGAFNTIKDFTKENAVLASVLGKTRKETKALADEAIRLGATYPVMAKEVLELETAYARLGFSQKEILDLTEATVVGAIALNSELEETAELTGAVVNTFDEFSTVDAPEIMDIMALATNKSALSFEKLNVALPIVGGAANAAGVNFTQLTALLGKLADAGIDTSSSATSLRNIFIESAKQGLSYGQILDKISTDQDKLTAANDEFGKRAAVSAVTLSKNIDGIRDLDTALQDAGGTAERMAKEQMNTLDGAVKGLSSAYESLILSFKNTEGGISNLINMLTGLLRNHSAVTDVLKENIAAFTDIGSSIKGLLTTLGFLNEETEESSSLMKTWGIVFKVITTPLRLLGLGIQFVIEKITLLIEKLQPAIDKLKLFAEGVKNAIGFIKGKFTKDGKDIEKASDELTEKIIENEKKITSTIKTENSIRATERDKEVQKNIKRLQKELAAKEALFAKAKEDSDALADSLVDEEMKLADEEIERLANQLDEEFKLQQEAAEKEIELEKEKQGRKAEVRDAALEAAGQIVSDRLTAGIDEDLARSQAAADAEQEILKDKLDKGLISEQEFAKKSAAIDLKSRQEAAKAEKKKALFDIAINTIIAIAKTFATLGWPAGIAGAAVMAAIGGAQAAAVASKPIPKFAEGEIDIKGNRHSHGGIKAEIEGGESVINREGTANAKGLLTAINKGLIKDSDMLLPNAGKIFSGADSSELVREHNATIIGMDKLINEQKLTRKAISNQPKHITQTTWAGQKYMIDKVNSRTTYLENYFG